MTRPDHEIDAYLEGELTPEQARALEAWINADPANAAAFLHLVRTHQVLGVIGKEQQLAREASEAETLDLASLAEMEASAEPTPYRDLAQPFAIEAADKASKEKDITLGQAFVDLRWAAGKVAVRLVRSPYGIASVIAAVLLLAFFLFNPLGNNQPAAPQTFTDNTQTKSDKPAESAPPILRDPPVATLTNTHNAQWGPAERASARGSAPIIGTRLHPNDRLNLTAGFAEITTKRGAVAILQAPATIELLDNDNAIRLHTGKLVGICETELSKGFVVKTDHADITDIGTRFGVATDAANGTLIDVFEGEVSVALTDSPKTARLLKRGESVAIDEEGLSVLQNREGVSAFERLAMMDSGIAQASDTIALIPNRPDQLDRSQYLSSTHAFVFEELRGVALPGDVNVAITEPGRYDRFLPDELPTRVIPAGTTVRSYIIRACSDGAGRMFQGKLVFDGQVLGVMTSKGDWKSFVKMTPGQSIDLKDELEPDQLLEGVGSGFTGGDDSNADWLELDEHRTTLAFGFYVDQQADHVRVFVAMPDEGSE